MNFNNILKLKKKKKAFGLSELMISILVAGFILSGSVAVIVQSFVSIQIVNQKVRANGFIQEQLNSLLQYKKSNWVSVVANTGTNGNLPRYVSFSTTANVSGTVTVSSGAPTTITGSSTSFLTDLVIGDSVSVSANPDVYIRVSGITSNTVLTVDAAPATGSGMTLTRFGKYKINNGSTTFVDNATSYTVKTTIDKAYRNNTSGCSLYGALDNSANGSCTYVEDIHYRWVTLSASWTDISNKPQNALFQTYINDYDNKVSVADTYDEMRIGAQYSNTQVLNSSGDGSISLTQSSPGVYLSSGTYISPNIDTLSSTTNYFILDNIIDLSLAGVSVSVSVRSANNLGALYSASWTSVDSYCLSTPPIISSSTNKECELYSSLPTLSNNRYFQYRFTLATSNTANTPLVKKVALYYK